MNFDEVYINVSKGDCTGWWYYEVAYCGITQTEGGPYKTEQAAISMAFKAAEAYLAPCDFMCESEDGITTCKTCQWQKNFNKFKRKWKENRKLWESKLV